jgi:hypothetical protein
MKKPTTYIRNIALAAMMITALGMSSASTVSAATLSSALTERQQARLQVIISKGDLEITRRLTKLQALTSKINGITRLSASDKTALSNEVTTTISGLTTLKAQLDGETTLEGAKTDAANIYSEYRVYALVVPKIHLIRAADSQQVTEAKLSALASKLQSRITVAKEAGKDTADLQSKLDDMNSKVTAAQAISTKVQSLVIDLQPSDYNSNHSILSGYSVQLKTAHADNLAAYTDAKAIVASLKTL